MYQVYFYKTPNGDQPVLDYLTDLLSKKDKDSCIKANKINDYISRYYLSMELVQVNRI